MSTSESEDEEQRPLLRTVKPVSVPRPDAGMNALGWGIFLGLVIVLLPLAPFVLIAWLFSRLFARADPRDRE